MPESPTLTQRIEAALRQAGIPLYYDNPSHRGDYFPGLPRQDHVLVEMDYCPVDGRSAVVVFPDAVQVWAQRCPYAFTTAHTVGKFYLYDTVEEMIQHVQRLRVQDRADCWQ